MTTVQDDTGVLAGDERMLIDGELQITDSGTTFDVIHPASEEVAGQGDVDRAFVALRMRTGNVTINGKSHFGIGMPA